MIHGPYPASAAAAASGHRPARAGVLLVLLAAAVALAGCAGAAGSPLDIPAGYRGPAPDVDQYSIGNAAGWELLLQVFVGTVLVLLGLYLRDKYTVTVD